MSLNRPGMENGKLHILWVNGWPEIGGAERAQLTLFRELTDRYRFTAVFPENASPSLLAAAGELGIQVHLAPLKMLSRTLNPGTLAEFGFRCAKANLKILKILRKERFDLIHTSYSYDLPYFAVAGRARRVPLFWFIQNPENFNRVKVTILNAARLSGMAGTSTKILSDALQAGVRAGKSDWIPNAYDDRIFGHSGARADSKTGDAVRIGFAGFFSARKGVLELCRAFGELNRQLKETGQKAPRVELWLAGEGEPQYRSEMEDVLRETGVENQVHFQEMIRSQKKMSEFYRSLDLYVMLSKREGMSVAMLEAMGSGVASAILSPWGDDVISDGETGIRLKSDQPGEVAEALLPLIFDPGKRERLAINGKERVRKEFSSGQVARKLDRFYLALISNRKN